MECFEPVHEIQEWTENHYDEHADMHYDGGGWSKIEKKVYVVKDCSGCGETHFLHDWEILKKVK